MDPALEERFGRAEIFCLIDGEGQWTFIESDAHRSASGAGIKTVQLLADHGVDTILAPEVGPKAQGALTPLGIKVYHFGTARTLKELLSLYGEGHLEERKAPVAGGGLRRA